MTKSLSFACLVSASALLSAAVACSASASSADFGAESKDRDAAGAIPGQADAGAADNGEAIESLVLVHASPNLPAFRVCFDALPEGAPLPRSRPMPRSNTVGVDIGSASYLDVDADLAALRAAGPSLPAHVISVDELADKANVPCGQLMDNLRSRNQLGVNYWDVSVPVEAVAPGAHAIAIVGCSNAFGSDRPECVVIKNGTVDQKNGTVAVRSLELPGRTTRFFSVAGALLTPRSDIVALKFRDVLGNPAFGQRTELKEQRDDGSDFEPNEIEALKFTTLGGANVTQTMIATQAYTAPLVLPRLYFQHDNPVTIALVGAQNPIPGHPGRALHLIAIPSRDPERPPPAPDAGTLPTFDASAPDAARDAKTD
ncbi:MAG: hypothetical protein HOO96_03410 [Polyangiaceae bacterium]|nr:hypothetical protein [Polyangiaceae bacterium]